MGLFSICISDQRLRGTDNVSDYWIEEARGIRRIKYIHRLKDSNSSLL